MRVQNHTLQTPYDIKGTKKVYRLENADVVPRHVLTNQSRPNSADTQQSLTPSPVQAAEREQEGQCRDQHAIPRRSSLPPIAV
jgi:hypothetical protein